jgi:hypothetical protein
MSICYGPQFVAHRFAAPLTWLAAALLFINPLCASAQDFQFVGLYVPGRAGPEPRCDLTFTQLASGSSDLRSPRGQQIRSIDGYDSGDRYCATYIQGDGASAVYRDKSLRDLARRIQGARGDMGLTDLEIIVSRGPTRYLSVWRSGAASGELVADLVPAEFAARAKALDRDGMRIAALAVTVANDTPRITAYFVRSPRRQSFLVAKDRKAFDTAHSKNVRSGMALIDFELFDTRAGRSYVGVWQETSGAGRFVEEKDWRSFVATFNASARESLQLLKVRAYRRSRTTGPGTTGNGPVTTTTPEPDPVVVVVVDSTGTRPEPEPGADPIVDPASDSDPVADNQGSGGGAPSGHGSSGLASLPTFGGYCRVHTLSINTCAESMGRSPAHIAAKLHALQTVSGRSCCEAIDVVQTQFGGNSCRIVDSLVREKYACN